MGPAIAVILSIIFLCVYLYSRNPPYLGLFSIAFFAFGLGDASQILLIPIDIGMNTMISAALYVVSALALAEGILRRSDRKLGWPVQVAAAALMLTLVYCFRYVYPSMLLRIGILNVGFGVLLILTAVKLRFLRHGRPIDRLVWWTLLLLALHFFPRGLMTIQAMASNGIGATDNADFQLALQLSVIPLSIVLAFVLLTAALVDIIDNLKDDRDHDVLTGLLNRRGFERRALAQISDNRNAPFSMVVCDIDHFKLINDTYGHRAGDRVLKEFAELLQQSLRSIDLIARIGGEEFVALLPGCNAQDMMFLIERLRRQLMDQRYANLPATQLVTASFGVSERLPREPLWDWFARADKALYAAKASGRNRIFIHANHGLINSAPDNGPGAGDSSRVVPIQRRTTRTAY